MWVKNCSASTTIFLIDFHSSSNGLFVAIEYRTRTVERTIGSEEKRNVLSSSCSEVNEEKARRSSLCINSVCRTYEDILEMNINARKNASVSIDDEHKFQVVRFLLHERKFLQLEIVPPFSFKRSPIPFFWVSIKRCKLVKWAISLNLRQQFCVGSKIRVDQR